MLYDKYNLYFRIIASIMNPTGLMHSMPKHKLAFYIVIVLFGVLYCTMSVANHYYFRTTTFDFGPYNYAFWDYAHFHITPCPIYKVFNSNNITFLQDHFSITLMFLVPFYWLLNWLTGTYTLLLVQVAFIVWGAWATYKVVSLKTGDGWLGVGAVVYYFLLQGRNSAFDEDCNIIIMCSCFVPVFIWYFESKRFVAATIVFVLALFSREDMPLWLPFVCLVLMLWHRKERKLVYACLGYIFASIVSFVLIFKVFIPAIHSSTVEYGLFEYSALGKDPYHALLFILRHPIDSFLMLFQNQSGDPINNGIKTEFYLVYLISGGFVLFFRPQYFIWFIPLLAQKMFNDQPIRWSTESYYTIQVATLLPIPVFIILSIVRSKIWRYLFAFILCGLALYITCYEANPSHRKFGYGNPVKRNIFNKAFFNPSYNVKTINRDLELIPPYASVSASASILPHLAQRKNIYEFPDAANAEYLAVFTFTDYFVMSQEQYSTQLYANYLFSSHWQVIAYDIPFLLLKRASGNNHAINYDSVLCNAEIMSSDHKHLIASDNELLNNEGSTWDSARIHSGKHSVKLTKDMAYGMTLPLKNIKTGDILCASVWRYSDDSANGMLVVSGGKGLYLPSANGINKDAAGWEQIILYFTVPDDYKDLGVYVWDNGGKQVWFDDMEVKIYRNK